MINIFRKIRKQLAADNNVMKYMRYAIGEILLVVIGILIALKINNWNEVYKIKLSANNHLQEFAENIKDDLAEIKSLKEFTDTTLIYSEKLSRQLKTLDPIDDKTTLYIIWLILEKTLHPHTNALETLNNSGEMVYLHESVQKNITAYYSLLNKIRERDEISNTFVKIRLEPYFFEHYNFIFNKANPWKPIEVYYQDDPRVIPQINKEKLLADKELEAMVFGRFFQTKAQNQYYKDAILKANKLINEIESKQ